MLLSFAIFLALDIIAVPMPLACTRGEVIIFQKLTSYYLSHLGVQLNARSQTRSRWKVRLTLSFMSLTHTLKAEHVVAYCKQNRLLKRELFDPQWHCYWVSIC